MINLPTQSSIIENIDNLRSYMTYGKINTMEQVMATKLLLAGFKFYMQHRIEIPYKWQLNGKKFFFADFYIPAYKIIIEVDGKGHLEESQWKNDLLKNNIYTALNYKLFRFTWNDVMETDSEKGITFLSFIDSFIKECGSEEKLIPVKDKNEKPKYSKIKQHLMNKLEENNMHGLKIIIHHNDSEILISKKLTVIIKIPYKFFKERLEDKKDIILSFMREKYPMLKTINLVLVQNNVS